MDDELIRYDLSLDVYFTYGPAAHVLSRPVLPRRAGQPIFMRGEVGVKDDGQLRPMVAHNTTHIDMPVHFLEGTADLARVAASFGANLRVNVYQPSKTDRFSVSYEQFWRSFTQLLGSARLVATTEPVLAAVLGIEGFVGPG